MDSAIEVDFSLHCTGLGVAYMTLDDTAIIQISTDSSGSAGEISSKNAPTEAIMVDIDTVK